MSTIRPLPLTTQHDVVWVGNSGITGHAYVVGAGQGDGSICGQATFPSRTYYMLERCSRCQVLAPNDTYTETITYPTTTTTTPTKEKNMATAKKATTTKSDAEILAEGLLKAAQDNGLCDKYYSTMQELNKKLSTPLPNELITKQREMGVEMYFGNDMVTIVGFPVGKNGRSTAATRTAIEKYFQDAWAEVLAAFPPDLGKALNPDDLALNVNAYD